MGELTFKDELKIFNQNRSAYPHIKPIEQTQEWSRYEYKNGLKFYPSLQAAKNG